MKNLKVDDKLLCAIAALEFLFLPNALLRFISAIIIYLIAEKAQVEKTIFLSITKVLMLLQIVVTIFVFVASSLFKIIL